MKKTREIHSLYKNWQKLPKELRNTPFFYNKCIVGKWHYHYENENGRIGLVRLNHSLNFLNENGFHYEACGSLDFERFPTLGLAEAAIYKKLCEEKHSLKILSIFK